LIELKKESTMKNALIVVFALTAFHLLAQAPTGGVERKGFVVGLSIGGGVISLADSDQEVAFEEVEGGLSLPNLKLGWMLNDRTALLASFTGMIYEYEGQDRSFDAFLPSVQYWIQDRFWINGGVGLAVDGPALYEELEGADWNFGCAVAASAGFELVQRRNFTIDLQSQIQLGRVFLDNDRHRDAAAFTIGLGFNWY
jgi:hypothetical protein